MQGRWCWAQTRGIKQPCPAAVWPDGWTQAARTDTGAMASFKKSFENLKGTSHSAAKGVTDTAGTKENGPPSAHKCCYLAKGLAWEDRKKIFLNIFRYYMLGCNTISDRARSSFSILNSCDVFQCRQLKRRCSRWQSPPKKPPTQVKVRFVSPSLEILFLKKGGWSQKNGFHSSQNRIYKYMVFLTHSSSGADHLNFNLH